MSDHLQNEGNGVASQKLTPEVTKGTTETARQAAGLGKQWQQMLTPIPTDRVMRSDMCKMHMELLEAGTETAQIVTETVIEHDSEFSYLFSLLQVASSSMMQPQCDASPSGRDEISREVRR